MLGLQIIWITIIFYGIWTWKYLDYEFGFQLLFMNLDLRILGLRTSFSKPWWSSLRKCSWRNFCFISSPLKNALSLSLYIYIYICGLSIKDLTNYLSVCGLNTSSRTVELVASYCLRVFSLSKFQSKSSKC